MSKKRQLPKVLLLDIETAPLLGYFWNMFQEINSNDLIESDWHVLSWAAKWLDDDKMMYMDQSKKKNMENDEALLKSIWKLIDEADVVISHNGKKFDIPKLAARFIKWGLEPPSSFKHIDTCQIAKNKFEFTSNKLEYLAEFLGCKYKKLKHKKFPGIELWKECLKGNKKAWKEMEKYNKNDVLTLQAVYEKLSPWDTSINFNLFRDDEEVVCNCGNATFKKRGYHYTSTSKFQRYKCKKCGAETRGRENLFSKEKRATLRAKT